MTYIREVTAAPEPPPRPAAIRVLVVDDDPYSRAGIRAILQQAPDLEVVGEAADGAEAIDRASAHFPDVVIMDIRMPGMDGITATAALVNAVRPPLVVALTSFDSEDAVFRALEAGAVSFLLKDTPPADLVGAIRTVMAGDAFLSPRATLHLIRRFGVGGRFTVQHDAQRLLGTLTEREREVAELVAEGLTNRLIADRLFLSEATVKVHLGRVMLKLAADTRVGVAIAVERARPGGRRR